MPENMRTWKGGNNFKKQSYNKVAEPLQYHQQLEKRVAVWRLVFGRPKVRTEYY